MHLQSTLALVALATTSFALTIKRTADPGIQAPAPRDASPVTSKRGFVYNDANLVNDILGSGAQGSWAYNWDSRDNGLDPTLEFVPMLWSDRSDHLDRWDANVKAMLDRGSTHLLSFNEPDLAEQANMSPSAAAAAHAKYLNPYGDKARIGSPAVTNSGDAGQGAAWLQDFISACGGAGCQVDFCVTHWYGPAGGEDALREHLQAVHGICGDRPVWLTEFAPQGDDTQSVEFIQNALKTMDGMEWLERYSYFMVDQGLTVNKALSAQGKAYFSTS